MRSPALLVLILPVVLGACREPQGERVEQLERRVVVLEQEIRALREDLRVLYGPNDAERVTDLARARTCALDLARALETYRADNRRYPPPSNLGSLPGACTGLRVNWQALRADRYEFHVRSPEGQLLTRQQSQ